MSKTETPPAPRSCSTSSSPCWHRCSSTAANGDIAFARMAAAETVNDYRAQTQDDLITVALIVGFGLTALASLSQSMDDNIRITTALRLRGNANACHRSAEQSRRAPQTEPPRTQASPAAAARTTARHNRTRRQDHRNPKAHRRSSGKLRHPTATRRTGKTRPPGPPGVARIAAGNRRRPRQYVPRGTPQRHHLGRSPEPLRQRPDDQ